MIVVGVAIWACMYSLNMVGFDSSQATIQTQLLANIMTRTRQLNDASIYLSQSFEELLRLGERDRPGYASFANAPEWLPAAWAMAKQFGSCFIGYASGEAIGYRTLNTTAIAFLTTDSGTGTGGSGTLFTHSTDEFGRVVTLLSSGPFNATASVWFTSAAMVDGFYLTKTYAFAGVDEVGIRCDSESLLSLR